MTSVQTIAVVLYVVGMTLAIAGPSIAAIRLVARYREAKAYKGTFADVNKMMNVDEVHNKALKDAGWGLAEFALVALGVIAASVASILLVVPPS